MNTTTETRDSDGRWAAIADRVPDKVTDAGRELCLQLVPAIAAREGAWMATRPATQMICTELARLAKRHHRLQEDRCNGPDFDGAEAATERVEARILELADALPEWAEPGELGEPTTGGRFGVRFGGDPRGCTVKLTGPTMIYDDWGREGVCVPQR